MIEKTKLRITTITPVTIGSGAELSPYSDYVIDKGRVCFIDKKKMVEKIMAKGDNCLDQYVYGVANGMDNNRSVFDLKNFLTGRNIVKDIHEIVSSKCYLTGNSSSKLPIKGVIKSPLGEPYFPGSSIKGALKTVLMYNWLRTNKSAWQLIEKTINDGNFNLLEKDFECSVNDAGIVIRANTIQQVTDSKMLAKDANIVVDCYRKMPIRFECIAKNQNTEFELTLDCYKWEDLARQCNAYALDCVKRELDILDCMNDSTQDDYYNYMADIEERIQNAKNQYAYLRIGFGKGYYLNSLGVAVYNYVSQKGRESLRNKFEGFINKEFAKKDKFGNRTEIDLDEFPKTRLFVTATQEPMGWIKIEKL